MMEDIKTTVERVLTRLQKKQRENPEEKLKKYLTKEEIKHIKSCKLHKDVLSIEMDSSVWLYALHCKKQELTAKMGLKDMRLYLGEYGESKKENTNQNQTRTNQTRSSAGSASDKR